MPHRIVQAMTADGEGSDNPTLIGSRLVIRPERADDGREISRVVAAAFRSADHARLVEVIRRSEGFIPELSLVAEFDGRIVGYVMISYVTLDSSDGRRQTVPTLSPLAVSPEVQHQGIGSRLVKAAIDAADSRDEQLVVFEGDPRFYGRLISGTNRWVAPTVERARCERKRSWARESASATRDFEHGRSSTDGGLPLALRR